MRNTHNSTQYKLLTAQPNVTLTRKHKCSSLSINRAASHAPDPHKTTLHSHKHVLTTESDIHHKIEIKLKGVLKKFEKWHNNKDFNRVQRYGTTIFISGPTNHIHVTDIYKCINKRVGIRISSVIFLWIKIINTKDTLSTRSPFLGNEAFPSSQLAQFVSVVRTSRYFRCPNAYYYYYYYFHLC